MSCYRFRARWVWSLAIASALLLLAGCQGLTGNGNQANAPSVTVGNASLDFGSVAVGSTKTLSDTLTNTSASPVTINTIQGVASGFAVSGITLPLTLAASQTISFNVAFTATTAGDPSGTISFLGSAGQSYVSVTTTADAVIAGSLTFSPSSVGFGSVNVGTAHTSTVTLQNNGGSDLVINSSTLGGDGFSMSSLATPLTISAGSSSSFTVTFTPTSAGSYSGSVAFDTTSDSISGSATLALGGTGVAVVTGALTANPTSLSFSSTQVGDSRNLSETLTNSGGATVSISQVDVTGAVFSVSGLGSLPISLTSGQSVTLTTTFAPTASGSASGSLSVVSDASNSPLAITLSGTGTSPGTLAVTPTGLSFGSVTVGSSGSLTGSLKASSGSVTISSASFSAGEFALSGITLPKTLAAGDSASFTVTFTPTATGAAAASLSFVSNASNSPTAQTLTGTGAVAAQHSVDLNWTPSENAVGYNVYRGTTSGGPYTMINSSLNGTTSYTDGTVTSGDTYYYVTTAVDSSSNESARSNQAQAVVPSP